MDLVQDVVYKFTSKGDLFLDALCGTIATGTTCLLFQQHFHLLICMEEPELRSLGSPIDS